MNCLSEHDRIRVVVAVASISAAAAIYADNHQDRKPYHTSALTRQMYVDELLDSTNPNCIPDVLSVSCSVFMMLLEDLCTLTSLCDTQFVSAEEQLAIFLYYGHTYATSRVIGDRFHRAPDTVEWCAYHNIAIN
jgi:hypothetical protein